MQAGFRGLLAFWVGGAVAPPLSPPVTAHHGADDYIDDLDEKRRTRLARLRADDDLLLEIIVNAVSRGLLH